jgi:uncharacterized protein (TIGR02246 family)
MLSLSCVGVVAISVCLGLFQVAPPKQQSREEDERTIRNMVDQTIARLNRGDVTAFDDYWDESADYVAVDGRLIKGRAQIQELFRQMIRGSAGQQSGIIEQIRFITPELATVDGSWTITGARDRSGNVLPDLKGRGFELVEKKYGKWRFIATREMVIFNGN